MIKRPSRKLISNSLRSSLPMCVNTFDYNAQDTTDPSVPLPSSVNVTVNAPAKLSFPSLGVSGFTSSSNSYGVTTVYPRLPFTVTNPTRIQFQALGVTGWSYSPRKPIAAISEIRVTRSSDSSSTVFDTPADSFESTNLITKFVNSGYYLRANSPYLFAVYGSLKSGTDTNAMLCFVYAPIKLLPQVFNLTGIVFFTTLDSMTIYSESTGSEVIGYGSVLFKVEEKVGQFTCSTSPSLIDTDNLTGDVFSTYNTVSPNPPGLEGNFSVLLGVTSLAFTL